MHIFISHASEDDAFVDLLADRLRGEGFTVWTDTDINTGIPWADAIERALRDASAVVVVLTPESTNSTYVAFEWAFAWGSGKALIPLLVRDTKIHPRLELIQYLDFRKPQASTWARLFEALRAPVVPAGQGLVQVRPPEVAALVARLGSPSAVERVEAVRSLALHTHPSAQDALVQALQSPFLDVRFEAALARASSGDERILRPLLEGMRAEDVGTRERARAAFLKLAAALAGPSVVDLLRSRLHQGALSGLLGRLRGAQSAKRLGEKDTNPSGDTISI